ncbi:MAG: dihydropteroate synthase [bacterium]|nr:dihydropteroate synthase [bacterium]
MMKNKFIDFIDNNNLIIFDGGLGTEILKRGIDLSAKCPESLNITNPKIIYEIHKSYIDAGANILTTNTFGCNRHKLESYGEGDNLKTYVKAGIEIAKKAASDKAFVAATTGTIGVLVEPLGPMSFNEVYNIYKELFEAFIEAKPDVIILETMIDIQEARIALLALKDISEDIPVIVSMTYENGERTTTGTPPEVAAAIFDRMGVDIIGANCSVGPDLMVDVVQKMRTVTDKPILIEANAGMPFIRNAETVFPLCPLDYTEEVVKIAEAGAKIIGGCCGTTPEHIKQLKNELFALNLAGIPSVRNRSLSFLTSRTKLLEIDKYPFMIGERINPNALKKVAESLQRGKFSFILKEAKEQVEAGADVLDINVSAVNTNEPENMKKLVTDLAGIVNVPLCIDSPDHRALEEGLKAFPGKALVNSINGEADRLDKILPLIKNYGASVIALTMDDNGIPDTVLGRLAIAERIVKECDKYAIPRGDIYFDTLVLTISTNPQGAKVTLDTIREVKKKFGVRSALGMSNISFGLPGRSIINSNFLAMAIEAGLDAAITNPKNELLRNTVYASALLCGYDKGAKKYIESFYETDIATKEKQESKDVDLKTAIIKGMKDQALEKLKEEKSSALETINNIIIPALDVVGDKYEKGEYFLPQLLLSAEAAKAVSSILQESFESKDSDDKTIVFATVKGDLHDIGKNIVISVLENYGYKVVDLGKSIAAKTIVDAAISNNAKAIGLSALMTTTMQEMSVVINELKARGIREDIKVLIGGAVVNQKYADKIAADAYGKDAMATVSVLRELKV